MFGHFLCQPVAVVVIAPVSCNPCYFVSWVVFWWLSIVQLQGLPEEEALSAVMTMGNALVPINGQRLVTLVRTVGMTLRAKLFLLAVVGYAYFF